MCVKALQVIVCLFFMAASVQAHELFDSSFSDGINAGEASALIMLLCIATVWMLYLVGAQKRPPSRWRNALFQTASGSSLLVMLGPLDTVAEGSAAAHMTQHMLLIGMIAPLWVLSRPLGQIAAGGGHWTAFCWKPFLQMTRYPMLAAWVHGAAIWLWHTPALYTLALQDPWWHALEHAVFLSTAVLFWWAVLQGATKSAPWSLLALLFTLIHTGFLGALLTFAPVPLYADALGIEDQQLAGLIMWVAGSVPYLLAVAAIGTRWYRGNGVGDIEREGTGAAKSLEGR